MQRTKRVRQSKMVVTETTDGRPQLRVGLLGLGTVGTGVAEILQRHADLIAQRAGVELRIVRALVRDTNRAREGAAAGVPCTSEPSEVVAASDVDIVVELMGGLEQAHGLIMQALEAGKSVVTANKAVMARFGQEILAAAHKHGGDVYFEAAVAGGIPIIRTLREGLASDRITSVTGILNGTTNFILGLMGEGGSYADTLAEAQRLGYAEANPTLDVNGGDAADKLAIMVQLAFGTTVRPADIPTEGITTLTPDVLADARRLGYSVKLLAIARRIPGAASDGHEALDVRVHPTLVPIGHALSTVPGPENAIAVESDALGRSLYQGAGAGGLPTGSAVVSDLVEAARNLKAGIHGRLVEDDPETAPRVLRPEQAVTAYYLRVMVDDEPGVLAAVATILANHGISLETVWQQASAAAQATSGVTQVPLVMTTHPASVGQMGQAMQAIEKLSVVHKPMQAIRIETFAS